METTMLLALGDRPFELPKDHPLTAEDVTALDVHLTGVTDAGLHCEAIWGNDLPLEEALDVRPNLEVRESAAYELCWRATSARGYVLELLDREMVAGHEETSAFLQTMFDALSAYVRHLLEIEEDERQALELAHATYADESVHEGADTTTMALQRPDGQDMVLHVEAGGETWVEGDGTFPVTEALTTTQRKRSATIVRKKADGSKDYKFPIPDKAHAKAALARLNQSDLSREEKIKVRRKAYKMLGYKVDKSGKRVEEADHATVPDMGQEGTVELLIEAPRPTLSDGQLIGTLIEVGFNRDKGRYYKDTALTESVAAGHFQNLKMYADHPTKAEFRDRPERSIKDWVATIDEAWIQEDGSVGGKVTVWRKWFKDYLQELKESGLESQIGLSILALAKSTPQTVSGVKTAVVEKFHSVLSVDWVTEPGAGGRVTQIWESYQPARTREMEMNVLESMKAAEALALIRESRPDVMKLLEADQTSAQEAAAREAEQDKKIQEAEAAKVAAEQRAEAAEGVAKQERAANAKASHKLALTEALGSSELPEPTKAKLIGQFAEPVLKEDGSYDTEGSAKALSEAIEAETAYVAQLLEAAGVKPGDKGKVQESATGGASGGSGIVGLGAGRAQVVGVSAVGEAHSKVISDLTRRFGGVPPKQAEVTTQEIAS